MRPSIRACTASLAFALSLAAAGCDHASSEQDIGVEQGRMTEPPPVVKGLDLAANERSIGSATQFLDARASRWVETRDCAMSCHTTYPYMLVRSAVATTATDASPTINAANARRQNDWASARPWYAAYTAGSKGTEAILTASAMAAIDARRGDGVLRPETRRAFDTMWSEQKNDGSWAWLDGFGLLPWEATVATNWGAIQAAWAIGVAPGGYLASCEANATCRPKLDRLRRHLGGLIGASGEGLPLHHRAWALIAAKGFTGLLDANGRRAINVAINAAQQRDGYWTQASLGIGAGDDTPSSYGTAVMALALINNDAPDGAGTPLAKALAWLRARQSADGAWHEPSFNRPGNAFNDGLMTDAATGYAALALDYAAH